MALALVITDAGRARLRNADGSGTRAVRIAAAGVSAAALAPTAVTAALPGEIKRIATLSGDAVAADIIHLVVRDETMASYTVRSFALYLDDGTLFAAYGQADPIIEKSAQALLLLAIDVTLADITAGQITFGNAVFLLPPATTERQGLIELATEAEAAAGTDRTRAVTPYTLRVTFGDVWRASNDGAGSGLDADLLDGRQGADYALLTGAAFTGVVAAPAFQASTPGFGGVALLPGGPAAHGYVSFRNAGNAQTGLIGSHGFGGALIYSCTAGHYFDANVGVQGGLNVVAGLTVNANTVWHAGNDGAGSGCDADLLDGRQGADYALLTGATFSGVVAAPAVQASTPGFGGVALLPGGPAAHGYVSFRNAGNAQTGLIGSHGFGAALIYSCTAGHYFDANVGVQGGLNVVAGLTVNANTVWHAGNDGAGSGCDADLLDGQQGSWYADILARLGFTPLNAAVYTGADILARLVTVDGAGSGLDADLLDGRQAAEFPLLTGAAFTGTVTAPAFQASTPGVGSIALLPGGATGNGYVSFRNAGNVQTGLIGSHNFGAALIYSCSAGHYFDANVGIQGGLNVVAGVTVNANTVWHAGNDGAGSGCDADLLDGQQGDWYRRWANLLDVPGAFPPTGHAHGAADLVGAFPGSLAENGYTLLPNGLILQWVTGPGMAAGDETTQLISFPVAFPNACFGALAGSRDDYFSTAADVMFSTIGAPGLDSVTVARKQFSERASDRVPSRAFVIAIGR